MIQTLPLVLFIVLTELSIGAFAVLVVLDWRNDVTRGFLVSYGLIYVFLTGLTYLFQQNFATPDLLNTYTLLDKGWTGYVTLPLLSFLLLMLPYNLLLLLDKKAGIQGKKKPWQVAAGEEDASKESEKTQKRVSTIRIVRLIFGALAVIAGLLMLFVLGMIYRPLAASNLSGLFTVASFFAAALALGGVMTAMWLGHWYLAATELTEKPLLFSTTLVLIGILCQVGFSLLAGPVIASANNTTSTVTATPTTGTNVTATATPDPGVKPANAPVVTPLSIDAIGWVRILVSFALPLILGGLAWKLVRDKSFQSATGMLYLVVVLTLAGESIARGLFLIGLQ